MFAMSTCATKRVSHNDAILVTLLYTFQFTLPFTLHLFNYNHGANAR
jgi:hypothetical protein